MPALAAEIGVAVTAGWFTFVDTNDWKQGVGMALAMLFGGAIHRGGAWYTNRK